MGRITINGTMSQFSRKLSVRSSGMPKLNKAAGRSLESQRINEKLENIKTNIGKQYQRLCDRDSYVTAEKVRNAFLGMGDDCRLLLQTFDEYLADFRKRVGKDRAYSSYEDYCKRRRRLASFLEYEYRVKDIAIKELKRDFIEKFVVPPLSVQGCAFRDDPFCAQEIADDLHGGVERLTSRFLQVSTRPNTRTPLPSASSYKGRDRCQVTPTIERYQPGCSSSAFTGLSHADVVKPTHADIHTDDNGER